MPSTPVSKRWSIATSTKVPLFFIEEINPVEISLVLKDFSFQKRNMKEDDIFPEYDCSFSHTQLLSDTL